MQNTCSETSIIKSENFQIRKIIYPYTKLRQGEFPFTYFECPFFMAERAKRICFCFVSSLRFYLFQFHSLFMIINSIANQI